NTSTAIHSYYSTFYIILPLTPRSTLFPYTTLFRSSDGQVTGGKVKLAHNPTAVDGTNTTTADPLALSNSADSKKLGTQFCNTDRSEEHTSELQSLAYLVCRLLLEKKNKQNNDEK